MANLSQLTSHDVRSGIKRGMTVGDFCGKYECSEDDFTQRLDIFFRKGAKSVLRELNANLKKRNGPGNSDQKRIQQVDPDKLPQGIHLDPSVRALFTPRTNATEQTTMNVSNNSESATPNTVMCPPPMANWTRSSSLSLSKAPS